MNVTVAAAAAHRGLGTEIVPERRVIIAVAVVVVIVCCAAII